MYVRRVPKEILSDLGTQFVSECMKEVTQLLSIKQLTTTPYHPMCNGLTEKFNETMKSMLKRLCSEQPRQNLCNMLYTTVLCIIILVNNLNQ